MRTQQTVHEAAKSLPAQRLEQHGPTWLGRGRKTGPTSLHQVEGVAGAWMVAEGIPILMELVQCRMSEPSGEDEEARDGGGGDGDGFVGRGMCGRADG